PAPPKIKKITGPVLGNDLTRVPEIQFQASPTADAEATKRIAHQMAKINHLNDKQTDGFIEALRGERPDLHGLPFAMGDACRTKGERSRQFARAVATVRRALQPSAQVSAAASATVPPSFSSSVSAPVPSGTATPPTSDSSAGTTNLPPPVTTVFIP